MEGTRCCICLDNKFPMQRLGCGCKSTWFHPECCSQLIYYSNPPYYCPVCRRNIPMNTNYSFSYDAGKEQKLLWQSLAVYATELVVCTIASLQGSEIVWIFPFQSAAILLCPFIISSNKIYNYFLFNSTFLIFVKGIFMLITRSSDSILQRFILIRILAYSHIFILYIMHLIQYQSSLYGYHVVDPFQPYAISRELVITETTTDTLERDVPLTATADRGRRHRHRRRRR